ncbi:MAG: glycoside hydrolase family 5 protein [bacterium]
MVRAIARRTVLKMMGAAAALPFVGCGQNIPAEEVRLPDSLLQVKGDKVVNQRDEEVWLRGVALGNDVWSGDQQISDAILQREDFTRLKSWGVNVVRYALTYEWFEDDADPYRYREQGFQDLTERLNWARENGIYVILDIHVPQGGYQSDGEGEALWTERDKQERLIGLWQEIARRYKDDPIVAGFEPLNEPISPTNRAWQNFAQELIDAIREIDQHHMIVMTNTLVTYDEEMVEFPIKPFLVDDDNVLYTGHLYEPFEFTHQGAFWADMPLGARYTDEVVREAEYAGGHYGNPGISEDTIDEEGNPAWQLLEGTWVNLHEQAGGAEFGQVAFQSSNEKGNIWVDRFILQEMDPDGNVSEVALRNPGFETQPVIEAIIDWSPGMEWYDFDHDMYNPPFWRLTDSDENWWLNDPDAVGVDRTEAQGDSPVASVRLGGLPFSSVYGDVANNYFRIKPGHQYKLSGWVKGEGLGRLDESEDADWNWNSFVINAFNGRTETWNKEYLRATMGNYTDWARVNNVPFFIGEFGATPSVIAGDDANWAEDMLQLFSEYGLHWTIWQYRGGMAPGLEIALISGNNVNPNIGSRQNIIDLVREYSRYYSSLLMKFLTRQRR